MSIIGTVKVTFRVFILSVNYSVACLHLQTLWEEVREEMIKEKGLEPEAADLIGNYVKHSGMWNQIFVFSPN